MLTHEHVSDPTKRANRGSGPARPFECRVVFTHASNYNSCCPLLNPAQKAPPRIVTQVDMIASWDIDPAQMWHAFSALVGRASPTPRVTLLSRPRAHRS